MCRLLTPAAWKVLNIEWMGTEEEDANKGRDNDKMSPPRCGGVAM